ncbi:MAG: UDP-N-acetylglucosamine 4,6-dehydratase (inverting) [Deltaproteobacteria bacterium]|uniref:UDP-N-acetylglucosamine 4,6-dehydratase (Inverting) n=1 Tax=Candidatus Zymogenus saltonus TaxID=2844893 RepID=A0A9D8PRZ1_9DELT|nr:UDP-N-acetylglucosamine 4,6-dehydratase (inverting) [Candidatus Zymogenus saltonus]
MFNDKTVLITGGTGSFGKKFVKTVIERYKPKKLIIFSRDELKQFDMSHELDNGKYKFLRFFIGDVRDQERLYEAFHGVDYVVHAAALKQIPTAEYNPFEAVKTNVLGGQNVIRAAINQKVKKVIALSTDKAANPINLYGATKLCSDKLFVAGNAMSGDSGTIFSVVRYGNVVGSRGSVIPYFLERKKTGVLPVTDEKMTRFSITLQESVDFVLNCLDIMYGGELFVPKIPSYRIIDIVKAIAPDARTSIVGIRPGEKLHELMITKDDARNTMEYDDFFIIQPNFDWWTNKEALKKAGGKRCPEGFYYSSGKNTEWLSIEDIKELVKEYCLEHGIE